MPGGIKRKDAPTEPTANEDRYVRSRISTPSKEPQLTVNYDEQLAFKLKVLVHLPPELDFFKETLQDIVNLCGSVQELDSRLVQDIVNKLINYGADIGTVEAADKILHTAADVTILKQIGSRTKTCQDLKDGILTMANAFIAPLANNMVLDWKQLCLFLEESPDQHHKSEVLNRVTGLTPGPVPIQQANPYPQEIPTETSEASKHSELQQGPGCSGEQSSSRDDSSAFTSKYPEFGLPKQKVAHNQYTQALDISTKTALVADMSKTASQKDKSSASPRTDDLLPLGSTSAVPEKNQLEQTKNRILDLCAFKVKGLAQAKDIEGKSAVQNMDKVMALTKQPPKLVTKESLDQLIAEETRNAKNDGLPTPQSALLISKQPQNNLFTTLEKELESDQATESPTKAKSKSAGALPTLKSLQIHRTEDDTAQTHHIISVGKSSKMMTCYYWYV